MIRRVRVIFNRDNAVWSGGSSFPATESCLIEDGKVLYDRIYEGGRSMTDAWGDLRENLIVYFFQIFYPAVVDLTRMPRPPTTDPDRALRSQSRNIRGRQAMLPEFYRWDPDRGKWHITSEGYLRRTYDYGGPMEIGIAGTAYNEMLKEDDAAPQIDEIQEKLKGRTQRFVVFVYPDRYDQEVRAMFILEIEFI